MKGGKGEREKKDQVNKNNWGQKREGTEELDKRRNKLPTPKLVP